MRGGRPGRGTERHRVDPPVEVVGRQPVGAGAAVLLARQGEGGAAAARAVEEGQDEAVVDALVAAAEGLRQQGVGLADARELRRVAAGAPRACRRREVGAGLALRRSEEHTSELQSLMRISYAVLCLKKKNKHITTDY